MEYKIRRAKLTDAKQIAKLYLEFWEPHKSADPLLELNKKMTLKSETNAAEKTIRKRNVHILVADLNEKIIGFVEFFIKKNEDCFKIKEYGYLNSATTLKEYRGKGVAKALTNKAMKFFKDKKIKYVRANVYNSNDVAMKTWEKLGFTAQSTIFIKELK